MNVYLQWGHVFANWLYKEGPTEGEKILAGGACSLEQTMF